MIELAVLAGPDSGKTFRPAVGSVSVGRGTTMTVRLSGAGVWDHHFDVVPSPDGRFELMATEGTKVTIDDGYVDRCPLRNGTIIGCGAVRLRFGLVPPIQRPLEIRERIFWLGFFAIIAAEIAVLAWVGQ